MKTRIAAAFCVAVVAAAVAPADVPVPRFTRTVPAAGQPLVADAATGLYWQGCPAGMTGDASSCSGTASAMNWQAALDYCQDSTWAGSTDWYLPNIDELASIVDDSRAGPSINPEAFPGMASDYWEWWSSSSYAGDASDAWGVYFGYGSVHLYPKTLTPYVRCVRRGP